MSIHTLTITLIESNAAVFTTDEADFMTVRADFDGEPAAQLTFTFMEDESMLTTFKTLDNSATPFILQSAVMKAILDRYTEDHELLTDVFYDDEGLARSIFIEFDY
jgi:hypothetical protein